jgi:hypothetical protein
MSDELVLIEKRDRIATVTLNRPPMNPMSVRMFDALHTALTEIEKDRAIRCITDSAAHVADRMANIGLPGPETSAFADRTSIATFVSSATRSPLGGVVALELTTDSLSKLLSVLRGERARHLGKRRYLHLDVHRQRNVVMLTRPLGRRSDRNTPFSNTAGIVSLMSEPSASRLSTPFSSNDPLRPNGDPSIDAPKSSDQ